MNQPFWIIVSPFMYRNLNVLVNTTWFEKSGSVAALNVVQYFWIYDGSSFAMARNNAAIFSRWKTTTLI